MQENFLNEAEQIITVPELNELEEQIKNDMRASNSVITNFSNGGIFKTIIFIFLQAVIDCYVLLKDIMSQVFISKAKGIWLDVKAADYGVVRKQATYTHGLITCSREETGNDVSIPKGSIFKTAIDVKGKEYRYFVIETMRMEASQLQVFVPVRAEFPGEEYNVAPGTIKYSLNHISGIDTINNDEGWISKEGTSTEDDESLRQRCRNIWDQLSTQPTAGKYESVVSAVEGAISVYVDDMHPRGQGTIDIIIVGSAGEPTPDLIERVQNEVDKIKGPYDNILIYGPNIIYQDVDITIYVNKYFGDVEQSRLEAESIVKDLFDISKRRQGNKLYKAELISELMKINHSINVVVDNPEEDVELDNKGLIMLGNLTVNIIRV